MDYNMLSQEYRIVNIYNSFTERYRKNPLDCSTSVHFKSCYGTCNIMLSSYEVVYKLFSVDYGAHSIYSLFRRLHKRNKNQLREKY